MFRRHEPDGRPLPSTSHWASLSAIRRGARLAIFILANTTPAGGFRRLPYDRSVHMEGLDEAKFPQRRSGPEGPPPRPLGGADMPRTPVRTS